MALFSPVLRLLSLFVFCLSAFLWAGTDKAEASASVEAQGVIVVANAADADSLRIARHYCERRRIPEGNIIALKMPLTETISWAQFVAEVWEPLAEALEAGAWVDWVRAGQDDLAGRRARVTNHHFVSYLVLCRGVPLRIAADGRLKDKPVEDLRAHISQLQVSNASVDSELAVMPAFRPPLSSYFPNPLFSKLAPDLADKNQVFRVARLDGPSVEDALHLVDQAIEAEECGLEGTACVDIGGIYPQGDFWFKETARLLRQCSFPLVVDQERSTFGPTAKVGAPVLYFGWYAPDLNGPFAQPGFRFPAGAIAYHLHSFSATTLRSATLGWTGPLLARGASVSFGNVYEPYLSLTLRPDLFMEVLLKGWTVGAAAAYAQPGYSWQNIMVGDPLYRPKLRR